MVSKKEPQVLGTPKQLYLYQVEKQIEFDGVEMGVLENGMPYLTERGLTRMCGLTKSALNEMSSNWAEEKIKPRGKEIAKLLIERGYNEENIYLKSDLKGKQINAYPEPVCLAVLEYYAFVSDPVRTEAQRAFRTLARTTFRAFIYGATGYSPEQKIIDSWKHFHDRVDLTSIAVPDGYFSIFNEISSMIVPMIRTGVYVSDKVIPDISVGRIWGEYWKNNELDKKYGDRIKYNHSYPDYYPQSKSNPQPSYAYPDTCLAEFRQWLRENYINSKFPKYILSKVKDLSISSKTAQQALSAFSINPYQISN